jgi:hypothetical protein
MLTADQINELHHLYWSERWAIRKIERHLHMGWRTIRKHLENPAQTPLPRPRSSKLNLFKTTIAELLEKDPTVSATLSGQRLQRSESKPEKRLGRRPQTRTGIPGRRLS